MGEQIGKTPVADALKMVYEARSIYSDGGIKLLGHKASNPYSTACDNLDKALEILA